MRNHHSSQYQNAVRNTLHRSSKHLFRDTSIHNPPIDQLPSRTQLLSTIKGCVQELGRIEVLQQHHLGEMNTLAEETRNLKLKMQEMVRLSHQSYSAEGKVVKKIPLASKVITKNLTKPASKAQIDYLELHTSSADESKNWPSSLSPQISYGKYFSGVSASERAERKERSLDLANNFRFSDVRLQSSFKEDTVSSPLITTLKKLRWQHRDYQDIRRWCKMVAEIFCETDEDASGSLEEEEFMKMINKLPFSESLRKKLRGQYKYIDVDKSGGISLTEFLNFVLQHKPFRTELQENGFNEPYDCRQNLSFWARIRLWVFKVITTPNFNIYSKVLFCFDLCITLVPVITLFISALRPTSMNELLWDEEIYFCIISVFFAVEWVFGLMLSNRRTEFVQSGYHILELVSFLPWIIYKSAGYTGDDITLNGFVLCRILRFFKLSRILPSMFSSLKEQLDIYENTLTLAYTSYKGMAVFMFFINLFLSTLVFAFERGKYDEDLKVWIRADEFSESPFSNFFNCFYFIFVTGTTLGYGDMTPTSYIGKFISMSAVAIGLINITFIINTIGDCFEEVFRNYLTERTRAIERDRSAFIRQNVNEAKKKVEDLRSKRGSTNEMPKIFSRLKNATVV